MHESSKSVFHKLKDTRYVSRYLVGEGIDIGCGPDPLSQYYELFPLMKSCRAWDLPDGDAQMMDGVDDNTYDFVHSAHCLEHMHDPHEALNNWVRILKPHGHLVCIIPDEDLYEQGIFPSTFNTDHKVTFTIQKKQSWSHKSINVTDMLAGLEHTIIIKKIELMDATFRYNLNSDIKKPRFDQTLTPIGESAIEFIIQKLP